MPKKLVLDRTICLILEGGLNKSVTVPAGEVWRVTIAGNGEVNKVYIYSQDTDKLGRVILGEGSTIRGDYDRSTSISKTISVMGIAFKLQEV